MASLAQRLNSADPALLLVVAAVYSLRPTSFQASFSLFTGFRE